MTASIEVGLVCLLALGAGSCAGLFMYCAMHARRARLSMLQRRFRLGHHEWVVQYFPDLSEQERVHAGRIASIIAAELGVDAGHLRPDDEIHHDYLLHGPCSVLDATWDALTSALADYAYSVMQRELSESESSQIRNWMSLDDLIRGIIRILGSG